jgi:hypothetical protein
MVAGGWWLDFGSKLEDASEYESGFQSWCGEIVGLRVLQV